MNDNTENDTFNSYLRVFIKLICQGVYFLLGGVYDVLLAIARQGEGIISGETMLNLFGRIQLIIGIFMLFRLASVILQGIINPDMLLDSKKGFQNIIVRVIVALTLLTLIVPITAIPPTNKDLSKLTGSERYQQNLRNSGILFGTLNEFQRRILDGNVLTKLLFLVHRR